MPVHVLMTGSIASLVSHCQVTSDFMSLKLGSAIAADLQPFTPQDPTPDILKQAAGRKCQTSCANPQNFTCQAYNLPVLLALPALHWHGQGLQWQGCSHE